jgi:hypothetical protein
MLVAYVQILLGATGHQVMAHGMHHGMFEDITSLFVQIRTCNNLAPRNTWYQGRWVFGSLALIQLYGFRKLTKLLKLSKLPCFKGITPCLDHLSTCNIFSHSFLNGHAPYSLEALRVDVLWLFKKEACLEHSFKFQPYHMYFFGNMLNIVERTMPMDL